MNDDAIEREVFINAGIEHVWSLVSKVGFWIGDELCFDTEAVEGELIAVDTGQYGSFPIRSTGWTRHTTPRIAGPAPFRVMYPSTGTRRSSNFH